MFELEAQFSLGLVHFQAESLTRNSNLLELDPNLFLPILRLLRFLQCDLVYPLNIGQVPFHFDFDVDRPISYLTVDLL